MKMRRILLIAGLTLSLAGCASYAGNGDVSRSSVAIPAPAGASSDLGQLVYLAAQTLADRSPGSLDKNRPIIVTTIVSIDDLSQSSTLGRLSSQLIANRLSQRGFLVRDVTYMKALTIEPNTGEMMLTRDASKLSTMVNAQAVVTGTYAVAGDEAYLNIRLLKADDGSVLASADVVVPLNRNTRELVASAR